MDRSKDLSILTDKPSKSKPNSFFNDENIQALKKKGKRGKTGETLFENYFFSH